LSGPDSVQPCKLVAAQGPVNASKISETGILHKSGGGGDQKRPAAALPSGRESGALNLR
jgi:hypothetical protein